MQVLHDVELALAGEAQRRAEVESLQRQAFDRLDVEPGAASRLQLLAQLFLRIAGWNEQIPVHPREVAVELFEGDDLLDAIDRRAVAVGGQPRALRAVQALQVVKPVIERTG